MMNVEQMSTADLLRESKLAMALAMGNVGPDTRARWRAVMAEIDTRLAVGGIDEDELAKAIADRDAAFGQMKANRTNLQFVQDEFDKGHPALKKVWGQDLSHGAKLLWAWAKENGHV